MSSLLLVLFFLLFLLIRKHVYAKIVYNKTEHLGMPLFAKQ